MRTSRKVYRMRHAAVDYKQSLLLVYYVNATGDDIWQMAEYVIKTVFDKFGVRLEPEVNVVE